MIIKSTSLLFVLTVFSFSLNAQIISLFTWEDTDIRKADIGPNFVSNKGSTKVYSSLGGVRGTKGLNPGSDKTNLNLVLADNPIFNVNGIDISIDYQRDESTGTFLIRGSSLVLNGCSNLAVSYRVEDSAAGYITINSGSVYNIPNDDIFRTYRFVYLPVSGVATLSVDGVTRWTNDGPDNRNMYWVGAGDLKFGNDVDGTGSNKPVFDNLIIAEVYDSPLPIELLSFKANVTENNTVKLAWETASEINNSFFTVERSQDVSTWENIIEVTGANNSNELIVYSALDEFPLTGLTYYRLKQTDFDGRFTYSKIEVVTTSLKESVNIFPNPALATITIESKNIQNIKIYDAVGKDITHLLTVLSISDSHISYQIQDLSEGIYFVKNNETVTQFIKK